jgi:hypothetical protein
MASLAPRLWVAAALALSLPGCASSPLLDMVGGGADLPAEGADQGLIRRATGEGLDGEGLTYPNLASVPPRPGSVRTPADRQALMDRLARDRAEAEASARELDAVAPVPPASASVSPERQPRPELPPMGGEVPPPSDAIRIPDAPPSPR